MEEFLKEHILPNAYGAIAAIVGAVWLWWRSKPKEKIENEGGLVGNAKEVLEMSERITERLEKQLEASDGIIESLKEKLRISIDEGNECKKTLNDIRAELADFKALCEGQKLELDALREECRLLRITIEANEKTDNISDSLHLN